MKVKANNFTIFWEGKAIAYATTAELDVNADTYEVGSATSGDWRTYKKGRKGWTVSAGHLLDMRAPRDLGPNYRSPFGMLLSDREVSIMFTDIEEHGQVPAADFRISGHVVYSGRVLVRRFTVSSVKGQWVTCQFEAVGCGELVETRTSDGENQD